VLKYPSFSLEIRTFFSIDVGRQFSPSPYTFLYSQKPIPHPSQKSFEQRTEMTFDRRLANIRGRWGTVKQGAVVFFDLFKKLNFTVSMLI